MFSGCLGGFKPTISACFDAAPNQVEPVQLDFRTKRQLSRLKATCRIFFLEFFKLWLLMGTAASDRILALEVRPGEKMVNESLAELPGGGDEKERKNSR